MSIVTFPRRTHESVCPDCGGTGIAFWPGLIRPCERCYPPARLADMTVADALAVFSSWECEVPFAGPTGDAMLDRRLAEAFRALLAQPGLVERQRWIEIEVFLNGSDFPPPAAPVDRYRATLIQWWLDLYEDAQRPEAAAR